MIRDLLRTALTGGTVLVLTGVIGLLVSLLSYRDQALPDPLIRFWARSILKAAGVKTVARGVEKVPAEGQFVLVLNHQSHFDGLVLVTQVPRHLRFVAKAELFRIPIFGSAIRAAGNISVDRRGGERDRDKLREAVQVVRERVSIVFFAEGTRSEDGVLRPFKKGAAALAIEAGVPIVPVAVSGTRNILPKGSKWIRGGQTAALVVGDPISTSGKTLDDRDRVIEQAHAAVAKLLEEANGLVAAG